MASWLFFRLAGVGLCGEAKTTANADQKGRSAPFSLPVFENVSWTGDPSQKPPPAGVIKRAGSSETDYGKRVQRKVGSGNVVFIASNKNKRWDQLFVPIALKESLPKRI
jgi:hypothetical protein